MYKQIGIYLFLLVFFTQHFGYLIAYNKFISHHDCNNEVSCIKAYRAIICCNGFCETKVEMDELSKNETKKKSWKGLEKQLVFTDDLITPFTFKKINCTEDNKITFSQNHHLIDKYLSSIYKPPCSLC